MYACVRVCMYVCVWVCVGVSERACVRACVVEFWKVCFALLLFGLSWSALCPVMTNVYK